jgi:post-segregation antitoxin (ccd killing protein)
MEKTMKRTSHISSETRELTDKELNKITSAMGESVRAQSINVSNIVQENLKAEFASRRKTVQIPAKSRKSVAA